MSKEKNNMVYSPKKKKYCNEEKAFYGIQGICVCV